MADNRPTYEIAAPQIAEYVQALWPGSLAMPFQIRDEEGRNIDPANDHLSGKTLLLVFLNDVRDESALPVLKAITRVRPTLESNGATVIAISASSDAKHNQHLKQNSGFFWPITGDATGAVFASYGLHKDNDEALRIVLVTPYRQIRAWFDTPADINDTVKKIMGLIENPQGDYDRQSETNWGAAHAPILLVPNVLTPEECGKLIQSFETGGPLMVRQPRSGEIVGNYKIPVYEHNRQDRIDEIIKDKDTLAFLDERIWGRIVPMIQKAFSFEVTRREDLHVARYVGERGGNKMGHRDNTSPATAYRRFALSMSLNDDYDGGEIVFKEYSPQGYRPPPGTAMVFSSSLLHEVLETTRGVRYNLISHFFSEQSLQQK